MPAPKGNKFWEARATNGREKIFSTPEALWDAAVEYFNWTDDNPLMSVELVKFQGEANQVSVPKMRAMTEIGFCLFVGCDKQTLDNYGSKPGYEDYFGVVSQIKDVIRTQKFQGASADLLNPNIIARDLGLADKKDHSSNDGSMAFDGMTSEQRKNRIAELLNKTNEK